MAIDHAVSHPVQHWRRIPAVNALALWRTRRRVVHAARRLGVNPGDGLQAMVARVAALRGQPIQLSVTALPRGTTGLCVFGRDTDTIIVTTAAEPLHRVLITLHELWHLIEDLAAPGPVARLWHRLAGRPLERAGLRRSRPRSPFGDHSVFDLDELPGMLDALPPELVQAVLEDRRQVRKRGEHNHRNDPAEVFARQMLQMLALDEDTAGTSSITSSLAHRGTGI
ncbi:hypothetical protein SHKM778_48520 [Streptomyces sp. KM77-8]|uniref:IrrE N-terminal-like domain-containing protein n=1 Tax=Streptomyces haneummycinicus TaxID=3074435 RepID=A0AAT9HLQ5_9ACTN